MDRNNNNGNSGMADKVAKADEFHAKTSGKEYDKLMDAEFDALMERDRKNTVVIIPPKFTRTISGKTLTLARTPKITKN